MNHSSSIVRIGTAVLAVAGIAFVADRPALTAPSPQEKPAAAPAPPAVPLRISVVISRFQGEKRVSNLPFTLTLNSGDRTSLRMGADVPVPQAAVKDGTTLSSYSYRGVGTQIDANAASILDDGRVRLSLTVNDSQVSIEDSPSAGPMRGLPRFQNFTSTATLLLRDGQTMQYTAATDKVTGEVVRVEVMLTVVK
jgi:Flp pilus assembly secretin CpaC